MSSEENQNPASATNKDQDNEKESSDTAAKDHLYSNPLLKSERETKQIVATRPPRRAYHHRGRVRDDEGPKEIRGRGFRERRGRGSRSKPERSKGRGAAGKIVFFLLFLSVQTGLMEMDIDRTLTGSIRLALLTPNSTTFDR